MLIPSVDLMAGKVVQLKQGKEKVLEYDNPMEIAMKFDKYGEIAVIDIDAAMNRGDNTSIIKDILKIAECRVGGGIRDIQKAKQLISMGAKKIIVGTKVFEDNKIQYEFLNELASTIGKRRVIIALDAINKEIVTEGWQHKTGYNIFDVIYKIEKYASEFLFTCVEKEGIMEGVDIETAKQLISATKNKITIAGGVSSVAEIKELSKLGANVQVGMAIYTNHIDITEAFIETLNWSSELIPTITQDYTGQILTLAYSNKESLKLTFATNNMWYFSRSRNKLWMKGETSGNAQQLIRLRQNCESNTLLATVKQNGVACHTGEYSCFGDRKFTLYELYEIVKDRIQNPSSQSYTAKLNNEMLKNKLIEETNELIEANDREKIIWEAADMFYFLTVFLAKTNIEIDDVLFELRRRRKI